jgi:hypothetical protein
MLEKEPSSLSRAGESSWDHAFLRPDGREPTEPIPPLHHPGSRWGSVLYGAVAILAFTLAVVALLAMAWKFGAA